MLCACALPTQLSTSDAPANDVKVSVPFDAWRFGYRRPGGSLDSEAQFSATGALIQNVAYAHDVGAFGRTGLDEYIHTDAAGRACQEKDAYWNVGGTLTADVFHFVDGATAIRVAADGMTLASATTGHETIALLPGVSGEVFTFDHAFGSEIIRGYLPGADSFDISHTLYTSFAELKSHAHQQAPAW
jgi:hypothetical protein